MRVRPRRFSVDTHLSNLNPKLNRAAGGICSILGFALQISILICLRRAMEPTVGGESPAHQETELTKSRRKATTNRCYRFFPVHKTPCIEGRLSS